MKSSTLRPAERPRKALHVVFLVLAAGAAMPVSEVAADVDGAADDGSGTPPRTVDPEQADRRAAGIISRTASPFCPGKTLEACPSPGAAEWRADIRDWTAQGLDATAIRERLQARAPGFDLRQSPGGVWPLFVAIGLLSLVALGLGAWRLVRRGGQTDTPGGDGPPSVDAPASPAPTGSAPTRDPYDDRLDEALDRM
ncbi:MAG TPA: hypothetical protein RMF84_04470 [Polyangiaceae bacterium LLY-WYZ-14_1]|nr:hypothetical protein [Polyangiaceae bacterium LLY-WYZ-14_1]